MQAPHTMPWHAALLHCHFHKLHQAAAPACCHHTMLPVMWQQILVLVSLLLGLMIKPGCWEHVKHSQGHQLSSRQADKAVMCQSGKHGGHA